MIGIIFSINPIGAIMASIYVAKFMNDVSMIIIKRIIGISLS